MRHIENRMFCTCNDECSEDAGDYAINGCWLLIWWLGPLQSTGAQSKESEEQGQRQQQSLLENINSTYGGLGTVWKWWVVA